MAWVTEVSTECFEKYACLCTHDRLLEITMEIKVQLYGQLKDLTGLSEWIIENIEDTNRLAEEMKRRYPLTADLPWLIAVDRTIIDGNTLLKEGQEIAFLPPYSGG